MSSIFPLVPFDSAPALQALPAILVGFAFGLVLERSGFGNARILAAQFYLHDMRVFKVMFTAIVTAAAGLALALGLGAVSLDAIAIPETFLWPHLAGGLLLGAGFIISGYCPGTSLVAMASGKWDGFATVGGVAVGSLVYAETYPLFADFASSGARGVLTLPDLLGVSFPVLVLVVLVLAVALFFGAEKVEAILSERRGLEKDRSWTAPGLTALGATLVVSLVATILGAPPASEAPSRTADPMTPLALAKALVADPNAILLVDARGRPACETGRIPTAICAEDAAEDWSALWPGRTLVVYGDDASRFGSYRGRLASLEGGLAAWQALASPGADLAALDPEARALAPALRAWASGAKMAAPAPGGPPKVRRKAGKKGGGCS